MRQNISKRIDPPSFNFELWAGRNREDRALLPVLYCPTIYHVVRHLLLILIPAVLLLLYIFQNNREENIHTICTTSNLCFMMRVFLERGNLETWKTAKLGLDDVDDCTREDDRVPLPCS